MKKLIIIGAGGHGKVAADIARKNGYDNIVFLDDDLTKNCPEYPVVGKSSDLKNFTGVDIFVAIGNAAIRKRLYEQIILLGNNIVSLVHPSAIIGNDVSIGIGTVVMAGAVINPGTRIGEMCIINTCATVGHDNHIGSFVHISSGAHLAGTVVVGEYTWIGVGATVINNVAIHSNCFIGAGTVVIKNIIRPGVYVGVPAKFLRN